MAAEFRLFQRWLPCRPCSFLLQCQMGQPQEMQRCASLHGAPDFHQPPERQLLCSLALLQLPVQEALPPQRFSTTLWENARPTTLMLLLTNSQRTSLASSCGG